MRASRQSASAVHHEIHRPPVESAKIRCPRGHGFNGPIEFLTIEEQPTAPAASVASASTNNAFAEVARDGAKGLGPDNPGR